MQALLCDEIMGALEDVTNKLVGTFGLEGDALKQAREELSAGPIMQYLEWVADRLAEQGGKYFVGGTLSMADLKVFSWVKGLNSGRLDHISNLLVKEVAPTLQAHCDRVAQLPKIASYYASQQV
ncbi:MAG: glutathione S-transferase C-terminal domain-containing protein [Arenicellaceae bacterium]|nr:glutathione S-transferase C-terminal domain-containing protein [Arenicellaceae bacterium]